jgi:hypothetical protein
MLSKNGGHKCVAIKEVVMYYRTVCQFRFHDLVVKRCLTRTVRGVFESHFYQSLLRVKNSSKPIIFAQDASFPAESII